MTTISQTKPDPRWYDLREKDAKTITKAAHILDKMKPGWWKRGRFSVRRLDLASCTNCVLGQVFKDEGGFEMVDKIRALTSDEKDVFASPGRFEYHWRRLIERRRRAAASSSVKSSWPTREQFWQDHRSKRFSEKRCGFHQPGLRRSSTRIARFTILRWSVVGWHALRLRSRRAKTTKTSGARKSSHAVAAPLDHVRPVRSKQKF